MSDKLSDYKRDFHYVKCLGHVFKCNSETLILSLLHHINFQTIFATNSTIILKNSHTSIKTLGIPRHFPSNSVPIVEGLRGVFKTDCDFFK